MIHCFLSQTFAILLHQSLVRANISFNSKGQFKSQDCSNYLSVTSLKACQYCKTFSTTASQNKSNKGLYATYSFYEMVHFMQQFTFAQAKCTALDPTKYFYKGASWGFLIPQITNIFSSFICL